MTSDWVPVFILRLRHQYQYKVHMLHRLTTQCFESDRHYLVQGVLLRIIETDSEK